MIEGSGSGSIPLTSGSGSGSWRPKNMWVRWIRIRNTDLNNMNHGPAQPQLNLSLLRSNFSLWPRAAPSIQLILLHVSKHRSLTTISQKKASLHSLVFARDTRNSDREKSSDPSVHICKYNRSHGRNLRSTPGQAVPFAQYYFKHSTTCTWSRSNGSDYPFYLLADLLHFLHENPLFARWSFYQAWDIRLQGFSTNQTCMGWWSKN
jgi:hypothetical protein